MIRELSLTLVAAVGLAACGGAQDTGAATEPGTAGATEAPPTTTPAPPPMAHQEKKKHSMCPMAKGVSVAVADVDGGATITWTGQPAQVADLRHKAQKMAKMHDKHKGEGMHGKMADKHKGEGMHGKMADKHKGEGMHGTMADKHKMPAAVLTVVDVPNGAQLLFKAKDGTKVDALRAQLRKHAQMMRDGKCKHMKHKKARQPATAEPAGPHDHGNTP